MKVDSGWTVVAQFLCDLMLAFSNNMPKDMLVYVLIYIIVLPADRKSYLMSNSTVPGDRVSATGPVVLLSISLSL